MEKPYWKTDRTTDTKLDKLQIALEAEDIKGVIANTMTQLKRRKMNRRFIQKSKSCCVIIDIIALCLN